MSVRRRLLFALVTAALVFGAAEGAARLAWFVLERRAFSRVKETGERVIRNNAINFVKEPDGVYGFRLRRGFARGGMVINEQGFAQREAVPVERVPGKLRVVAMGESTTQGHDVDKANYPHFLRRLLENLGADHDGVEMINAGVSGWISDQIALRAERELAAYRPDVVVLYVGWNDFFTYDPFEPPPRVSHFQLGYGTRFNLTATSRLRSVALLSALYGRAAVALREIHENTQASGDWRATYSFFLANLDRIVNAYRATNPSTVIVVCTLAGRWPYGDEEAYGEKDGHTWWMQKRSFSPVQAAAAFDRFNDLIRAYVTERGLVLADVRAEFAALDRGRMFWDVAHMYEDGYTLVAEVIYDSLLSSGIVCGRPSEWLGVLHQRYAVR